MVKTATELSNAFSRIREQEIKRRDRFAQDAQGVVPFEVAGMDAPPASVEINVFADVQQRLPQLNREDLHDLFVQLDKVKQALVHEPTVRAMLSTAQPAVGMASERGSRQSTPVTSSSVSELRNLSVNKTHTVVSRMMLQADALSNDFDKILRNAKAEDMAASVATLPDPHVMSTVGLSHTNGASRQDSTPIQLANLRDGIDSLHLT